MKSIILFNEFYCWEKKKDYYVSRCRVGSDGCIHEPDTRTRLGWIACKFIRLDPFAKIHQNQRKEKYTFFTSILPLFFTQSKQLKNPFVFPLLSLPSIFFPSIFHSYTNRVSGMLSSSLSISAGQESH